MAKRRNEHNLDNSNTRIDPKCQSSSENLRAGDDTSKQQVDLARVLKIKW